jgi:hypothetical protein
VLGTLLTLCSRGLQRARFGPVAWPWPILRRTQGVFDSLGNTAGSSCHARDVPERLLGLPGSHVLNLHLQDYMVPRSMVEVLQEVVSKQDVKIRLLQTNMDKALTKLKKNLMPGRGPGRSQETQVRSGRGCDGLCRVQVSGKEERGSESSPKGRRSGNERSGGSGCWLGHG